MPIHFGYPAAALVIMAGSMLALKLLDRLAHRVPRWIVNAAANPRLLQAAGIDPPARRPASAHRFR